MRVIIAGGRDRRLNDEAIEFLDRMAGGVDIECVLHGGCRGIDMDADAWVKSRGIKVEVYKADWEKYGPAAGPIRNREMVVRADAAVVFQGGRGTDSLFTTAKRRSLMIYDMQSLPLPTRSDVIKLLRQT